MKPPAKPRTPRVSAAERGGDVAPSPQPDELVVDEDYQAGHDVIVAAEAEDEAWLQEIEEREDVLPIRPPTPLDPRRLEKKRSARRVLLVRIGVAVGVLALLAALGWVVLASSLLALKADRITVDGAGTYVDPAAVTQVVAAHEGTALALLPASDIADELEQMPAIAQAEVSRAWPQGVRVTLTPREPVAVVTNEDADSADLISPDGVTIVTLPIDQVPAGLAELRVETDDPATRKAVLDVLASLPDALRQQVAQSRADSPESVELTLLDDSVVFWGSPADAELKASVLTTLLQVGAAHYDVSIPTAPLTR